MIQHIMILIIVMMIIIIKTGKIVYEMIIPQWYEIDTPIVICDAQNLSKIICVFSLFELKVCFDEFGHHIK